MSQLRSNLIRLFISISAIGIILFLLRNEVGEAVHILRNDVVWSWFFVGIVCYFVANAIIAARLKYVFRTHDMNLTYLNALYLNFLGLFFNLFLPSAIGGDIAKAYYAYKHTGRKIESTSCVLQDRIIGFVSLMFLALVALAVTQRGIVNSNVQTLVYLFGAMMALIVLFFASRRFARNFKFLRFLAPSEKIKALFEQLYDAMYHFKSHPGTMFLAIVLALLGQSTFIIVHYYIAECLHVDIPVSVFFILVPIVTIVSMVPSLGGLGVREAGIIFFFKQYMPTEKALVLSLLVDMVIYGYSIGSGLVYALRGGLKSQTFHEIEALET